MKIIFDTPEEALEVIDVIHELAIRGDKTKDSEAAKEMYEQAKLHIEETLKKAVLSNQS